MDDWIRLEHPSRHGRPGRAGEPGREERENYYNVSRPGLTNHDGSDRGSVRGCNLPGPRGPAGAVKVLLADRRLGSWDSDGGAAQSCRGALARRPVRPAVGAGRCYG